MEFTKKEFGEFRKDLTASVASVEEKYGIKIKLGNISYSEFEFDIKLNATKASNGVDVAKEKFIKVCHLYGFKPEDYMREFNLSGGKFYLTGFNPRSPKNDCAIQRVSDGKAFKCSHKALAH